VNHSGNNNQSSSSNFCGSSASKGASRYLQGDKVCPCRHKREGESRVDGGRKEASPVATEGSSDRSGSCSSGGGAERCSCGGGKRRSYEKYDDKNPSGDTSNKGTRRRATVGGQASCCRCSCTSRGSKERLNFLERQRNKAGASNANGLSSNAGSSIVRRGSNASHRSTASYRSGTSASHLTTSSSRRRTDCTCSKCVPRRNVGGKAECGCAAQSQKSSTAVADEPSLSGSVWVKRDVVSLRNSVPKPVTSLASGVFRNSADPVLVKSHRLQDFTKDPPVVHTSSKDVLNGNIPLESSIDIVPPACDDGNPVVSKASAENLIEDDANINSIVTLASTVADAELSKSRRLQSTISGEFPQAEESVNISSLAEPKTTASNVVDIQFADESHSMDNLSLTHRLPPVNGIRSHAATEEEAKLSVSVLDSSGSNVDGEDCDDVEDALLQSFKAEEYSDTRDFYLQIIEDDDYNLEQYSPMCKELYPHNGYFAAQTATSPDSENNRKSSRASNLDLLSKVHGLNNPEASPARNLGTICRSASLRSDIQGVAQDKVFLKRLTELDIEPRVEESIFVLQKPKWATSSGHLETDLDSVLGSPIAGGSQMPMTGIDLPGYTKSRRYKEKALTSPNSERWSPEDGYSACKGKSLRYSDPTAVASEPCSPSAKGMVNAEATSYRNLYDQQKIIFCTNDFMFDNGNRSDSLTGEPFGKQNFLGECRNDILRNRIVVNDDESFRVSATSITEHSKRPGSYRGKRTAHSAGHLSEKGNSDPADTFDFDLEHRRAYTGLSANQAEDFMKEYLKNVFLETSSTDRQLANNTLDAFIKENNLNPADLNRNTLTESTGKSSKKTSFFWRRPKSTSKFSFSPNSGGEARRDADEEKEDKRLIERLSSEHSGSQNRQLSRFGRFFSKSNAKSSVD